MKLYRPIFSMVLLTTSGLLGSLGCDGSSSGNDNTGGSSAGGSDAGGGGSSAGSAGSTGNAGSAGNGSAGSTGSAGSSGSAGASAGGIFEVPEPWTKDVSGTAPASSSDAIINALEASGGWGNGNNFQIDFAIAVLNSDASTPRQTVVEPSTGYCYDGPDCDALPIQVPLPPNGNAEGQSDYSCPVDNEDCHILVVAHDEKKLYELYNATEAGSNVAALGAFVWDLTKQYPDNLRGEQCTAADAAGLPMSALIPTADEVAAGEIRHAIRFILPNARMKKGVYVHPASHAGAPSSADPDAPPYGVRFRLKASFDEGPYTAGEKVILKAMKTYGIILSDGGNIALTFADDRLSSAKWADLGVSAQSFLGVQVSDFEVVDLGPEITSTYDCVRNP